MGRTQSDLTGILVIDKPGLPQYEADPAGFREPPTSHDIVQWVRRRTGQQRIGHTGTLDPFASGVLVLCLGRATKLVQYYQGHDKTYWGRVVLGTATDSYDGQGQVTATAPLPRVDPAGLDQVLAQFRGEIQQIPPVYSAIKQGGESVHYKARRGESVTMQARTVTVYQLDLLETHEQDGRIHMLDLRITCSAGTYIRSLAYDLGAALGSAGHLSVLRRERVGELTLDHAHALGAMAHLTREDAQSAPGAGGWADFLHAPGFGLGMPALDLSAELLERISFGQKVILTQSEAQLPPGTLAQARDAQGEFQGIVTSLAPADGVPGTVWKAEKWFTA